MFTLHPDDKVGIISPASFVERSDLETGMAYLRNFGLIPELGQYALEKWRYMGGTPQQRADDIMSFFHNDDIKAIFATRGGGGSSYILPFLDYKFISEHPKPIFGLSDVTVLQNALYTQSRNISYSGLMLKYDFSRGNISPELDKSFQNIISGNPHDYHGGQTVVPGFAEAPIIGGNLSALTYLFGTPYMPDLSDKILLLEDIGGKSFWLDLRLEQLRQTPGFNRLKGMIFGSFTNITTVNPEDGSVDEIIDNFCADLNIPIIKNFPYGHIPTRHILPIGLPVKMDSRSCTITF